MPAVRSASKGIKAPQIFDLVSPTIDSRHSAGSAWNLLQQLRFSMTTRQGNSGRIWAFLDSLCRGRKYLLCAVRTCWLWGIRGSVTPEDQRAGAQTEHPEHGPHLLEHKICHLLQRRPYNVKSSCGSQHTRCQITKPVLFYLSISQFHYVCSGCQNMFRSECVRLVHSHPSGVTYAAHSIENP